MYMRVHHRQHYEIINEFEEQQFVRLRPGGHLKRELDDYFSSLEKKTNQDDGDKELEKELRDIPTLMRAGSFNIQQQGNLDLPIKILFRDRRQRHQRSRQVSNKIHIKNDFCDTWNNFVDLFNSILFYQRSKDLYYSVWIWLSMFVIYVSVFNEQAKDVFRTEQNCAGSNEHVYARFNYTRGRET
ncbi:Hypothetical predicted protein [Mytilus galloprovincialis]|uniref:Uncharacterized protein n=1 Tax=Mytilus galloprovincialis TaxID=29158 RepID=A0A8B6FC63_MYTGA|nr:Hypothetical predicted protein [Mytilus galloprovincialis]